VKLSLLITYHNEGAWLGECLQSLLPQLGTDDEVIVYDDASNIPAEPHLPQDPRVRWLRGQANIGPSRARNALFAASSGTHIHFHDADDLFAAEWRASVVGAFGATGADVVFTDVASFDDAGSYSPHVMEIAQLETDCDLLKRALRGALLAPAGTYTRAAVERVGGYRADLWQSEDYDFHIRVALLSPKWAVVARDLVLIRRHPQQRSRSTQEVWSAALDSLEQLVDRIPPVARVHAAHAATRAGSQLFACGARAEAVRAFDLAKRFGGARYERSAMQRLTKVVGPARAERLAAWYRKLTPNALRKRLQRMV
jgi:hypothetical protein